MVLASIGGIYAASFFLLARVIDPLDIRPSRGTAALRLPLLVYVTKNPRVNSFCGKAYWPVLRMWQSVRPVQFVEDARVFKLNSPTLYERIIKSITN